MPEVLRNLTMPIIVSWEPILEASAETDACAKVMEDKQNDLKRKMEHGSRLERKNAFEENKCKARANLW